MQLLTQAARSPDATPKVRQNLALSLALAEIGGFAVLLWGFLRGL